ncbi:Ribonuclease H2 subunit A [Astathelohania contejeani]|uniref:Ribonuclease n=1 Tax=Astathelohania contejeani TaxID=164912 RepID=A0ABQ7I1F3_9MICR|nr:Ribonuclease H2 subunit A [Thelohania contejeani]
MSNLEIEKLNIIDSFLPLFDEEVIVGIDEAGRGPVLGYMVYGALISNKIDLSLFKFKDSKLMTPEQRKLGYETIQRNDNTFGYITHSLHPSYISQNMLSKTKNLNVISFECVTGILTEIFKKYKKVKCIYIDTLGSPETYLIMLRKKFKNQKFIVESKADTKYKIVAGASILAKVRRDELLEEAGYNGVGSGYPSDPQTVEWLKKNYNPLFGFPEIARFSWKTIEKFFPSRSQTSKPLKGGYKELYFTDI